jgi:hypothetical protein
MVLSWIPDSGKSGMGMGMIPDPGRQIGDGGGDGPPIPGKSGMGPPSPIPGKSGMGMGMGIDRGFRALANGSVEPAYGRSGPGNATNGAPGRAFSLVTFRARCHTARGQALQALKFPGVHAALGLREGLGCADFKSPSNVGLLASEAVSSVT